MPIEKDQTHRKTTTTAATNNNSNTTASSTPQPQQQHRYKTRLQERVEQDLAIQYHLPTEHHHHQYPTRLQEHFEQVHPIHNTMTNNESSNEEQPVMFETHYCEKRQREFFYNPADNTVQWYAPSVALPMEKEQARVLVLEEETEDEESRHDEEPQTRPRKSARKAYAIMLLVAAVLGLQIWLLFGTSSAAVPTAPAVTEITPEPAAPVDVQVIVESMEETEEIVVDSSIETETPEEAPSEPEHVEEEVAEEQPEPVVEEPVVVPEEIPVEAVGETVAEVAEVQEEATQEEVAAEEQQCQGEGCSDMDMSEFAASHNIQGRTRGILDRIETELHNQDMEDKKNLCKLPFANRMFPYCKTYKWNELDQEIILDE